MGRCVRVATTQNAKESCRKLGLCEYNIAFSTIEDAPYREEYSGQVLECHDATLDLAQSKTHTCLKKYRGYG